MRGLVCMVMEGPFAKVSYSETSPKYIKTERLLQQTPILTTCIDHEYSTYFITCLSI